VGGDSTTMPNKARIEAIEGEPKIRRIKIANPPLNILTPETLKDLQDTITAIEGDKEAITVIVEGEGKAFSAGADVKLLAKTSPEEAWEYIKLGQTILSKIILGGKIYIAKVHGYALGGGLELALACDITIAEKQAKLALPEITLGIHPGWTGTQTLPKIVGWKRALELILTGKTLSGEEAEKIGLINMAVEAEKLEETVMGIAKTIIGNAPKALANAKRLIREAAWRSLEEGLEMERESFKKLMETRDAREGLKAFIEKRKPIYTGE